MYVYNLTKKNSFHCQQAGLLISKITIFFPLVKNITYFYIAIVFILIFRQEIVFASQDLKNIKKSACDPLFKNLPGHIAACRGYARAFNPKDECAFHADLAKKSFSSYTADDYCALMSISIRNQCDDKKLAIKDECKDVCKLISAAFTHTTENPSCATLATNYQYDCNSLVYVLENGEYLGFYGQSEITTKIWYGLKEAGIEDKNSKAKLDAAIKKLPKNEIQRKLHPELVKIQIKLDQELAKFNQLFPNALKDIELSPITDYIELQKLLNVPEDSLAPNQRILEVLKKINTLAQIGMPSGTTKCSLEDLKLNFEERTLDPTDYIQELKELLKILVLNLDDYKNNSSKGIEFLTNLESTNIKISNTALREGLQKVFQDAYLVISNNKYQNKDSIECNEAKDQKIIDELKKTVSDIKNKIIEYVLERMADENSTKENPVNSGIREEDRFLHMFAKGSTNDSTCSPEHSTSTISDKEYIAKVRKIQYQFLRAYQELKSLSGNEDDYNAKVITIVSGLYHMAFHCQDGQRRVVRDIYEKLAPNDLKNLLIKNITKLKELEEKNHFFIENKSTSLIDRTDNSRHSSSSSLGQSSNSSFAPCANTRNLSTNSISTSNISTSSISTSNIITNNLPNTTYENINPKPLTADEGWVLKMKIDIQLTKDMVFDNYLAKKGIGNNEISAKIATWQHYQDRLGLTPDQSDYELMWANLGNSSVIRQKLNKKFIEEIIKTVRKLYSAEIKSMFIPFDKHIDFDILAPIYLKSINVFKCQDHSELTSKLTINTDSPSTINSPSNSELNSPIPSGINTPIYRINRTNPPPPSPNNPNSSNSSPPSSPWSIIWSSL